MSQKLRAYGESRCQHTDWAIDGPVPAEYQCVLELGHLDPHHCQHGFTLPENKKSSLYRQMVALAQTIPAKPHPDTVSLARVGDVLDKLQESPEDVWISANDVRAELGIRK